MIGTSLPLRTFNGRVVLESGETQMKKIVTLSVGDGETANPFLSVGIQHPLFGLIAPPTIDLIKRDIEKHFERFQQANRAELRTVAVGESPSDPAEIEVHVVYVDLETDQPQEVVTDLGSG